MNWIRKCREFILEFYSNWSNFTGQLVERWHVRLWSGKSELQMSTGIIGHICYFSYCFKYRRKQTSGINYRSIPISVLIVGYKTLESASISGRVKPITAKISNHHSFHAWRSAIKGTVWNVDWVWLAGGKVVVKARLCRARTRARTEFSSRGKQRRLPPERNFRRRSRRRLCSTNQRSQFRPRHHVYKLRHFTAIQTKNTLQCNWVLLYYVIYER